MLGRSKTKNRCVAYRPTPVQGHEGHLPSECKKCFANCENELLPSENLVCSQCLQAYLRHPSAKVRSAFVKAAIHDRTLSVTELGYFLDDDDTEVVLVATAGIKSLGRRSEICSD
jgi:hypothetical protein